MARTFRHVATVKGMGEFPIDMLRYDRCTPYTEQDSYEITARHRGVRTVQVVVKTDSPVNPFTPKRWESFLWSVEDVKTERYA